MKARKQLVEAAARPKSIHERILGGVQGAQDDALVFAASSIIHEISSSAYDGRPITRVVSTENRSYTLRGGLGAGADGARPVVIVLAEPLQNLKPADDRLLQKYGLTVKEQRVAFLLAANKTNEEIAQDLFISPHTARHHTQSVLSKLGVRSRREVAGRLAR